MRILTYNIHGWQTAGGSPNLDAVAHTISATQAEVVGLNEVFFPQPIPNGDKPALAWLADRLDMYFVFGPCLRWPATVDLPENGYGNALLSRWPIVASAAHHLTPVAGKEMRGLLEGRILLPGGRPFTVYVTHLDHTDEPTRLMQLRAVRTWTVRDRNRPHLVLGDFNAVSPWDYQGRPERLAVLALGRGRHMANGDAGPQVVVQMEKGGYIDVYRQFGLPGRSTFLPARQPLRIDYVWASQALQPYLSGCDIWQEPAGQEASDHRPVLAEVEV